MQRNTILPGDAWRLAEQLPDESINCIVTSPPYFGLRDYGAEGQFGLEPTPEAFVEKLVTLFDALKRALRHDGTVWLNLGDSYNGSGDAGGDYGPGGSKEGQPKYPGRSVTGLKPKDLVGIPWRVAFALQAAGWYLRQDIIWHKPNPMPESVSDRCTKAHEYIFLLSRSPRYYYDADAVRESNAGDLPYGDKRNFKMNDAAAQGRHGANSMFNGGSREEYIEKYYMNGRNKRSVWTVTTKPYSGAHFAVFPPDLIEPCILAGCPHKVCSECGASWVRVVERERIKELDSPRYSGVSMRKDANDGIFRHSRQTIGYEPTCTCNAETQPGIVLDPFLGSGTTAVVARSLGRDWLGFELNPAYIDLAYRRIAGTQPPLGMEL